MAHWKLILSYNGETFHGWQVQPGVATVQGTLADALHRITGETVLPQGSGHTDAGVHAMAQVASFTLRTSLPAHNLQRALNRLLPPKIRVISAEIVPSSFHARHSACRKTYEYRVFERRVLDEAGRAGPESICSPFLSSFVWDCRWPVRIDLLQAAAAQMLGTHDFSAMAAAARPPRGDQNESQPNPIKTIYSSNWRRVDGLLVYGVCGSGFLHHMVRNLVGTMVDIGRGSRKLEDLPTLLASRDRSGAGPTAPASGLYLVEVGYRPNMDDAHGPSLSNDAQEPDTVRAGVSV